ncbi:hypothetical protein TNCT_654851 [Trichonephila clavata]|uniref:Uncharacterized protein n=1 Tax=Trichonephila clavata TaxID=2740835 RepID=A0A8X6J7D1_TRICU|nr:hypothetical protein TNCT_654851 [Trichonephila clavata]
MSTQDSRQGESRNASLRRRETAAVPSVGPVYLSIYNRTPSDEFSYPSPYDLDPEIFVTDSPEYTRRCKIFIKKIRDSKCYRILLYATLLFISVKTTLLTSKYLPDCLDNIALIHTTTEMCLFGIFGSMCRLVPLIFGRFARESVEYIAGTPAGIFLFCFGLATIAELITMAVIVQQISCKPFVHGMANVNFGIFLMAILSSLIYLDELIVLLHPSHPCSLCNFMRSLCNCCR